MRTITPIIFLFCANILFAQFPCSTGFNGNGTDEFITVPNTDAINLQNTRNRTIEFWFKAPDITTKQVIYEEGGNVNAFIFYLEGERIYLGAYRESTDVAANRRFFRSGVGNIEANKWYHIALTLEDTTSPDLTLKWYLNGVEQDSQDGLQVNNHSGTISYARNGDNLRYPNSLVSNWTASSVGGSTSETYNDTFTGSIGTTYAYSGNINLFRIWNVARTQAEIDTNKSTLLTSGTDLVAYADLDRIYYVPDGATEISLTAFVSVTTQFTTIPNTDAINDQNTSDRTIELRFRATDLTTRQVIYEEGGNTNAFKIFLDGGRVYFSVYRSNASSAANRRYFRSGAGELSIGQWYHIAVTLDNSTTLKWFLDGVEQDSQPGLLVNTHTGDINLGRSGGGMRYPSSLLDADWDDSSILTSDSETYDGATTDNDSSPYNYTGDIELFRIWNVARTPSEIDTNKNTFLDSGTQLVAYQSGAQINYQPNGGSAPSASEDAQGVITWDGSDSNSWTTATNWVGDSPPDITRSQKIIITNNGTNPVIAANTNVGFLSISSGVNLVVQSGFTLNVYYELVNNGTITVENGASLIYHNCVNPISGTGTFNVIRNTRSYSSNNFFSYWSSPIPNASISTVFPDAEEVYIYDSSSSSANWVEVGAVNMISANGYAIQNESLGGEVRNFIGNLNNGGFDKTLFFNTNEDEGEVGNVWSTGGDNLVGNPYPSALDWDLVIGDTDNANIDGTIYLWNQQSASVGDNNVSDYLQYNPTGPSTTVADFKIGTAQGFFVRVDDIGVGNTTTLKLKATHQVAGDNTSTTFYKSNNKKSEITNKHKARSWFKLKRENTYNSILIGFVKGATEKFDRIYDGPFDINQKSLGFYSLVEETKKATIQGLPLLTENEKVVPLGFIVDEVGEYSISLTEEYIDDSYTIYLEDIEQSLIVNLNKTAYSFIINTTGENNERFRLFYTKQDKILSRESYQLDDDELLVYINSSKELVVKYPNLEEVKKIILHTVLGREVKVFQPNKNKNIANVQTGIYLVKTFLKGNTSITKKIVIANQ